MRGTHHLGRRGRCGPGPGARTRRASTEGARQPLGDLSRRLVREGERADARRLDRELLEQEADPLDEAERLPRPWPGEHEQRLGGRLDRFSLGGRGDAEGRDVRIPRLAALARDDGGCHPKRSRRHPERSRGICTRRHPERSRGIYTRRHSERSRGICTWGVERGEGTGWGRHALKLTRLARRRQGRTRLCVTRSALRRTRRRPARSR